MKNIHTKAIMYAGALFLIILSILAIMTTIYVMNGNKSYNENTISVTGTAKVSAAPDIATFSFSVQETAKDSKTAQNIINEKISKILNGLEDLHVDEKDIKTDSYTIYPKYEWVKLANKDKTEISLDGELYFPNQNKNRIQVGFDVRQNVRVKVRALDNVSDVLILFAENGVENLNGPNFQIDDLDSLQEEARLEAIIKAKAKAKRLAKDLDVKLGKIISFNENSYGAQPYYREKFAIAQAVSFDVAEFAPKIPVGENDISATVTITYKIK